MDEPGNVVVAVRCRPLNLRELARGASCVVSMSGQQTVVTQTTTGKKRGFTFDHSFWTAGDKRAADYASQSLVYSTIGESVLRHALSGYHCCVFAYGQTGSGKSYTMMGKENSDEEAGLIPRICQQLFATIDGQSEEGVTHHVEVSYLEIYNERVRDLLNPGPLDRSLRVREHPALGPYVEDLTQAAVTSHTDMLAHMRQGNKARTVAATNMNEASSRSHAVFTITLTTKSFGTARVSRIRLVDLAGSERASVSTGMRFKEGAKINQSLGALGKVISALADKAQKKNVEFVGYRDSVLTWLLRDSLGGNSRTFMIATVSPADSAETLSTLRYADRAKHIVNRATVNQDDNNATVRLVRELRDQVAGLKRLLALAPGGDLEDQLRANEKLMDQLNQTWEQKLKRTQELQAERERALASLGIAVDAVGVHAPRDTPHLVNLSEDPLMSECLVYNLRRGRTTAGSGDDVDIRLGARGGVAPVHCFFEYDEGGGVAVHAIGGALVLVNGRPIGLPRVLRSGYRVIVGTAFVFRFSHPSEARQGPEAGDWLDAWHEAHPDDYDDDTLTVDYSPSIWSDTVSECFSDHSESGTQRPTVVSGRNPLSQVKSSSLRTRALSLLSQSKKEAAGIRRNSLSTGSVVPNKAVLPTSISSERLGLLVVRMWRRHKLVRAGQTMLLNAVHLKEANVISKELGQKAVYQFALLRGSAEAFPVSPLEPDALPALLSDTIDSGCSSFLLPHVVVKVLDIANTCWYVWPLAEFLRRLDGMRRLAAVKGSFREHLVLAPFHTHPPPRFSCIGSATWPVTAVARRAYSARFDAPLADALLSNSRQSARVVGSLAALPLQGGANCGKWSVIVHVATLSGVRETDVTRVHCRVALGGSQWACSGALSGFNEGPINVQFRHQWTVASLADTTYLSIDIFGSVQPPFLRRAFHADVQLEQSLRREPFAAGDPDLSASQRLLVERLHEDELFVDSQHELTLWVRVLELGSDGRWIQAPCAHATKPAFVLRQGLQRRIHVTVAHNASHHLQITRVSALRVGRPQLVDGKGRTAFTSEEQTMVPLSPVSVALDKEEDGARVDNRCFVTVVAPWDTSVYASPLLDLPTDRGMCVRLALDLSLEIARGHAPIELSTYVYTQIHSRQSSLTNWSDIILSGLGTWRSNQSSDIIQPLHNSNEFAPLVDPVFRVFSVTLSPVNATQGGSTDLWRLNTGKKYVRGEETLLPWQPRSVQYVDDFYRKLYVDDWRMHVACSRQQIEALGDSILPSTEDVEMVRQSLNGDGGSRLLLTLRQERIRRRVIDAVRRIRSFRCVPDTGLGLQQEPMESSISDPSLLSAAKQIVRRAPSSIRPVLMQGHFCYRGWVDFLDTNHGVWSRRWLVVERPYVFVFATDDCVFLENIVNISSARISVDPNVEDMLGRCGVLALYTATNAYMFCPLPVDDIQKWISAIDEWYWIL